MTATWPPNPTQAPIWILQEFLANWTCPPTPSTTTREEHLQRHRLYVESMVNRLWSLGFTAGAGYGLSIAGGPIIVSAKGDTS